MIYFSTFPQRQHTKQVSSASLKTYMYTYALTYAKLQYKLQAAKDIDTWVSGYKSLDEAAWLLPTPNPIISGKALHQTN